MDLVNFLSS